MRKYNLLKIYYVSKKYNKMFITFQIESELARNSGRIDQL